MTDSADNMEAAPQLGLQGTAPANVAAASSEHVDNIETSYMGHHAEALARLGWKLLPLWWPVQDGARWLCACPDGRTCDAPAKHPLVKAGTRLANASSDADVVAKWWRRWPDANIGAAMRPSGLLAIDCDVDPAQDEGGYEFLQHTCAALDIELDESMVQRSGKGGRHIFFQHPPQDVKGRVGQLHLVDIRSTNYVVMAPSRHVNGCQYEWIARGAPPVISGGLLNVITAKRGSNASSSTGNGRGGGQDPSGDSYRDVKHSGQGPAARGRDDWFNSFIYELRRVGLGRDAAEVELRQRFETTEQPDGDRYEWPQVLEKLDRIYSDVEPDEVAEPGAWRPDLQHLSDDGNALLFVQQHAHQVRYAVDSKHWFAWDETRWLPDAETLVLDVARQTARSLIGLAARVTDDDAQARAISHAKSSLSAGRIKAMRDLAVSDPRVAIKVSDFDASPWLLNTPSGTVDLRTGELREQRREDMLSKITNIPYDPGAEAPTWRQWVNWAMGGRPDLVEFLQRAVGYAMTGEVSEQVFFLLYGTGANGKSTFLTVMESILGDYAMHAEPDLLAPARGAHPTGQAALFGKRFVTAIETREGAPLDPRIVKQLTGGDTITARRMYKDFFEFRPTHTIFFSVNHTPEINDTSYGMWRRVLLVPWDQRVDPVSKVDDYDKRLLAAEAPGILRWMVDGAVMWYRDKHADGLRVPDSVRLHTAEYQHDQDDLTEFFEDRIVQDELGFVEGKVLHAAYQHWCGLYPSGEVLGKTTLLRRVEAAFPSVTRGQRAIGGRNPRGLIGIRLREAGE